MDLQGLAQPGSEEARLLRRIEKARLPRHVAVIMDGNGRWAGLRSLPRVAGHRAGIESVREIIRTSAQLGIEVLTLYAFSVENWKRPRSEVRTLMNLLRQYIRKELDALHEGNVRLRAIGRIHELEEPIRDALRRAQEKTSQNTGLILNVALNYGGRAEIVDSVNSILEAQRRNGGTGLVDEQTLSNHLYTSGTPDPDLLIRTSGEMRVSNFLLWQIAYAEIYITPTLWPDFRRKDLFRAILEFQRRDRRYGGI
jgi:undecaprenyl diphosphate synthase